MKARRAKSGKRRNVLPKTIFAKWVLDNSKVPWLDANQDIEQLAEKGEIVHVGEYKLVKRGKLSLNLMVR